MLVARIIQRILDPQNPVDIDRLLVVTFTKAAAAEMRERIGAAIEAECEKDPQNTHLRRQSALIHNAMITTIDSFCLFVVRNHFEEISLDPNFRIADEGEIRLLEQAKPVLDALLSWANEMQAKTAPKSALGRAIHYLLEQWPYLTRYLEDGRLELSNNRAERSIKPFVMGRKNWLFANTPGGAQASSVIYSLIETAKENGLDPYRYLLWLLQNASCLSETDEAWAKKLLPARTPEECYMPQK